MAQASETVVEPVSEAESDASAGSLGLYTKIADEAMQLAHSPSEKDSNAIVAVIVQKLKEKHPLPEGTSDEPLYDVARDMYWKWQDEQRKKKTGKDELATCEPDDIMGC